jgi:prepilin-type processing-associated H-X9-DG protein
MDLVGEIPDNYENKEFSMEVNDVTRASPGLRHGGGANLLFVDGHAGTHKLKAVAKHLRGVSKGMTVMTWESEYVDAAGTPVEPKDYAKTMAAQGLRRNPEMPLVWSELGGIYRKVE